MDMHILIGFTHNALPADTYAWVVSILDKGCFIAVINRIGLLGHTTTDKPLEEFISFATVSGLTARISYKTMATTKGL